MQPVRPLVTAVGRVQLSEEVAGHLREATRKAAERATRTFRTRLSAGEKTCRKRLATLAVVTTRIRLRADRTTSSPRPEAAPPAAPRARGPRPARSG